MNIEKLSQIFAFISLNTSLTTSICLSRLSNPTNRSPNWVRTVYERFSHPVSDLPLPLPHQNLHNSMCVTTSILCYVLITTKHNQNGLNHFSSVEILGRNIQYQLFMKPKPKKIKIWRKKDSLNFDCTRNLLVLLIVLLCKRTSCSLELFNISSLCALLSWLIHADILWFLTRIIWLRFRLWRARQIICL